MTVDSFEVWWKDAAVPFIIQSSCPINGPDFFLHNPFPLPTLGISLQIWDSSDENSELCSVQLFTLSNNARSTVSKSQFELCCSLFVVQWLSTFCDAEFDCTRDLVSTSVVLVSSQANYQSIASAYGYAYMHVLCFDASTCRLIFLLSLLQIALTFWTKRLREILTQIGVGNESTVCFYTEYKHHTAFTVTSCRTRGKST